MGNLLKIFLMLINRKIIGKFLNKRPRGYPFNESNIKYGLLLGDTIFKHTKTLALCVMYLFYIIESEHPALKKLNQAKY